jgi:hypothetical protein
MGLEPTTSEATTRCYHQLSYAHHNTVTLLLATMSGINNRLAWLSQEQSLVVTHDEVASRLLLSWFQLMADWRRPEGRQTSSFLQCMHILAWALMISEQ